MLSHEFFTTGFFLIHKLYCQDLSMLRYTKLFKNNSYSPIKFSIKQSLLSKTVNYKNERRSYE